MPVFSLDRSGPVRAVLLTTLLCLAAVSSAQDFKLAVSATPVSLDPHFFNHVPSIMIDNHMFEALVKRDADHRILPGLAQSWSMVNKLTWEFKLRKGVKFHDGSELTVEDVMWSLERPATIVGSPSKFDIYTKPIILKKVMAPDTFRLTTREPYPLLLQDLASIAIVSKKATAGVPSEEFASGRGMVGTGPFRFVKFLRDDRIELDRFDGYWGTAPAWSHVTIRFITNGATRMAALLSNDVQAIENVPTPDLARVRADATLTMASKVSHRLVYIFVDTVRDNSPFVTDSDGKPLARNPLKDLRVRQAISMAINRDAIRDRVMEELSLPTNNLVPATFHGYNPALKVVRFDPDGARKLLAAAGYPHGFGITIHTSNNRYVNDERVGQTIAQMLNRVGISAKLEAMPFALYSARGAKGEFSMGISSWGAATGEASQPLRALVACPDVEQGFGSYNWLKYCNPAVQAVLLKSLYTVDDAQRGKLLQEAGALAVNDGGVIPIHQQIGTWGMRKGIVFVPRADERTHAYEFSPAR
ncbi:MAG: ABC transporter substrate-binding protein [Pseudomonadota bacterium]